jgi:multisubunit Na+/H+ antiporter MnhG subunit
LYRGFRSGQNIGTDEKDDQSAVSSTVRNYGIYQDGERMRTITVIMFIILYAPLVAHAVRKYKQFKEIK